MRGVTAGETAHILPTGQRSALGGRRVGSSRGGSIPPEGTSPDGQAHTGEVMLADRRASLTRQTHGVDGVQRRSTRGPGSPRCAPINRAMTMYRPKRRLSLPEYAKEQGRLSDYEAFVAEVRKAHEDGRLRLVQLQDFSGIQLPGVEV